VLSAELGWGQSTFSQQLGEINTYWKHFETSKERGVPEACLRLAKAWLEIRMGVRTGGAFCSGRTIWKEATLLMGGKKEGSEGDKPICRASQAVKVTVSAAANPVHLLQHSLVTLGFAKCTDRALACPMPRDF
jgi:hypothetical protein